MKSSWKTTLLGILGALGLLLTAAVAQWDGDPLTVANWAVALPAALAVLGIGGAARDNDVSSEAAGAK